MSRPRQKATEKKRSKYIKNVTIGGMNKKDAALAAGFTLGMATNAAGRIETPEVLAAIESLEKGLLEGIPTELLIRKFAEGLDATTVKIAQRDGEITDVQAFPDYPTRLQYLEKIALISRRYQPTNTTEHTGKHGGPIELTALTREQLEQRKQWLERQLGISRPCSADGRALPPPSGGSEAE
jgi:hypothetical protein